jgi:AraC family transcriptional regulator
MSQSAPMAEIPYGIAGIRELATSVILLLQTATKEVERDLKSAETFIAKASSLLQVEADRIMVSDRDARSGGLAPWQVRRVKSFVEERLADSILIEDLGEVARLSTTHFSRAFKRSFGEAPHGYLVRRRLARARHLMLTSDIGLSEVALECGFSDQAHLCKLFRQTMGTSPAAWRREQRDAIQPNAASLGFVPREAA